MCVCVCVCVCVASVVFGGGDSRSALPPQLLSRSRARYTHVPPASCPSYITHPVQQRTRENGTPTLPAPIARRVEGQEVALGVAFQGRGSGGGTAEGAEGFLQVAPL